MTIASEVVTAASEILAGDDSGRAATALEEALHTYHPYDEDFEDLLETLALYSPTMGPPYTDHMQLCDAIRGSRIGSNSGGT
jgi:hypothetical protein